MYIPAQHDMTKMVNGCQKYSLSTKEPDLPFKEAVQSVTRDWKKMEIFDFLNWLKFIEEGTHMKYKFAQVWYEEWTAGIFPSY